MLIKLSKHSGNSSKLARKLLILRVANSSGLKVYDYTLRLSIRDLIPISYSLLIL